MELWWVFLSAVVAYVVYKLVVFATADGDLVLLSKRLRPEYFAGKVVWVTGASSGIGEALCYRLSRLGAKLILSARSVEKLQKVKDTLADPQNARVLPVDLSDPESTRTAAGKAGELFGKIDILINNAGVAQHALFVDVEDKADRTVMEVNFFAPRTLTKGVLPGMISGGVGHIVNILSLSSKIVALGATSYSAAKFALIGLMDSLRLEMLDKSIHVTNVCPGAVNTPIFKTALTKDGTPLGLEEYPHPRAMSPDRCAELILVGVSNQLREVWISNHPYLLLPYLAHYMPSVLWLFLKQAAPAYLEKLGRIKK